MSELYVFQNIIERGILQTNLKIVSDIIILIYSVFSISHPHI